MTARRFITLLCVLALVLVVMGAGRFSIDALVERRLVATERCAKWLRFCSRPKATGTGF